MNGLRQNKQRYDEDLARRIQRVYNRPLQFETSKNDKFSQDKKMQEKLNNIAYYDEEDEAEEMKN